ncbi:Ribokinase-like protein [Hanseniaspora valbyensis NRRL Y-1626]|uniref:pyridoxal kinase n=1 Tax=Hanseniaspora valbyensis NRRL Y-1626 TaxID=766949 RepID=A0A1B7TBD9_9ASCO|nr:Ribokinase-like protein [Hanseniaspora valbyensis NRRL Y-1626]
MNFLSISSHVVHGYVGNKSINIAIQYKPNVENIDLINTIQLNVHPKFINDNKSVASIAASKYDPEIIVNDIISKSLKTFLNCKYDCLIISYFNNNIGLDLLSKNLYKFEQSVKIVDPIMGDNGKIYCNPLLISAYKNMITNNEIDCLLPNQFELELLTDNSESTAIKDLLYYKDLIKQFHSKYPKVQNLIITSVELNPKENYILISNKTTVKKIKLTNYYEDTIIYGCGDLFTGLLAYEYTQNKNTKNIFEIVRSVVFAVQLMIKKSIHFRIALNEVVGIDNKPSSYRYQLNGLDLVNCIDDFLAKSSEQIIKDNETIFINKYQVDTL